MPELAYFRTPWRWGLGGVNVMIAVKLKSIIFIVSVMSTVK